jgi:hypothetical protein
MYGKQVSLPAIVAASLLSFGVARADVIANPGFETGDLTGWAADGPVSVVSSFGPTLFSGFTSGPCCGDSHFFAVLDASNNGGLGTSLSQTILNVAAGQDLYESYRFIVDDNIVGLSDSVSIQISEGGVPVDQIFLSGIDVGGGEGPWTPIYFHAPVAGDYTISFNLTGTFDTGPATSFLLVDTPEPAGLAVIAVGLAALGLIRRRGG